MNDKRDLIEYIILGSFGTAAVAGFIYIVIAINTIGF